MASTSDIRTGLILKIDGNLYTVIEFGENKTARAAAKVWAKMKGVDNNRTIEKTWNSGETIHPVRVEKHAYQFLYKDDMGYNFMNTETFEQIPIPGEQIEGVQYLKDGDIVEVQVHAESETILTAEMPNHVILEITYTEPGLRGDTATNTLKLATVETGAEVRVPLFIETGEKVKIDTRTGTYIERAK